MRDCSGKESETMTDKTEIQLAEIIALLKAQNELLTKCLANLETITVMQWK